MWIWNKGGCVDRLHTSEREVRRTLRSAYLPIHGNFIPRIIITKMCSIRLLKSWWLKGDCYVSGGSNYNYYISNFWAYDLVMYIESLYLLGAGASRKKSIQVQFCNCSWTSFLCIAPEQMIVNEALGTDGVSLSIWLLFIPGKVMKCSELHSYKSGSLIQIH